MRAVLIGLGGIGSHLVEPLARTLVFSKSERAPKTLILVDGDTYEKKNRQRQRFDIAANKAEATKEWIAPPFPDIQVEAKPHFISEDNIFALIREGDVVLLAVDNHATRKLISEYAETLGSVLVISGGNELYDGNIQVYEKSAGTALLPPLTWMHPEIEHPNDRNPAELSCEELAASGSTQLLAVNNMAAALMLNALLLWLDGKTPPYHELYFDISTGNVRPAKVKH